MTPTSSPSFCSQGWRVVPWMSIVVVIVVFASSVLNTSTSPTISNWPVRKENIDEYSFPKVGESTPNYALNIFMVFCALTSAGVEFLISHRSNRLVGAILVFVVMIEGDLLTGIITFWGKTYVAEPRPDFKSRCLLSAEAIPTFDAQGLIQCVTSDSDVDEGRSSFVSGHASISFCAGIMCSVYLLWVLFYRIPSSAPWLQDKWFQFHEMLTFVCIFPFLCACGIAASRVVDHVHSPANVAIGAIVGSICSVFYSMRLLRLWRRCQIQLQSEEGDEQEQEGRDSTEKPISNGGLSTNNNNNNNNPVRHGATSTSVDSV